MSKEERGNFCVYVCMRRGMSQWLVDIRRHGCTREFWRYTGSKSLASRIATSNICLTISPAIQPHITLTRATHGQAAMFSRSISAFRQRALMPLPLHGLHSTLPGLRTSTFKTQLATIVKVTSVQRRDPNSPRTYDIPIRVSHTHTHARENGKKTYEVDVLMADRDEAEWSHVDGDGWGDVCWTFEIVEGVDMIEGLAYHAASMRHVAKHGSRDASYDEYAHAFSGWVTWVEAKIMLRDQVSYIDEDGHEVYGEPDDDQQG
ncbi:hypothetical protein BDV95DRAFT_76033 [Massariosphaeria phaeospora]|uniref:Uncharacterized protein n=1 Tax=Massariosphaeria phaeospora TaxID=100035 RepID=A0A7C8I640_9PLEO|nr:hypothetical protein BDV95DRAFT_76033 [Massariosphaeria phaeospora]